MGEGNNDICAFRLHFRDRFIGGFYDILHLHLPLEILFVPCHDLRRDKAYVADFYFLLITAFVSDRFLFYHIRRVTVFAASCFDVGIYNREIGSFDCAVEKVEPVVEFMIAKRSGVVFQRIHDADNRMGFRAGDNVVFLIFHRVFSQRIPLNQVAVIHKQGVRVLLAVLLDQLRCSRQTEIRRFFVAVVIVIHHVGMNISRSQNTQMHLRSRAFFCMNGWCWED